MDIKSIKRNLKLNGIAFAFLCAQPPHIDIVCTAIEVDEDDRLAKIIDADNTYKQTIDASNESARNDASDKAAQAILAIHNRQKQVLQEAELPYRPFVFVSGKHSKQTYPAQVQDPRKSFFTSNLTTTFSKNASIRQAFEAAMQGCSFSLNNFVPPVPHSDLSDEEVREGTTERYIAINREIRRLKPSFENPATREEALKALIEQARALGKQEVRGAAGDKVMYVDMIKPMWLNLINPVAPDYKTNPEAREAAPIYDFARWDTRIRQAIADSFTDEYRKKYPRHPVSNVMFSCATDNSRPFADVIHAMTLDQIDVLRGRMTEEQIHHHDMKYFSETLRSFASELTLPEDWLCLGCY